MIFHHALRALGLRPDRVMHVGDSLHSDIAGAAGAGIAATWIRREDRIHDIGEHEPWRTVTRLNQLHDLLA